MGDKQETVADICAEMRNIVYDVRGGDVRALAARIEVAHKREMLTQKYQHERTKRFLMQLCAEGGTVCGICDRNDCPMFGTKEEANDEDAK